MDYSSLGGALMAVFIFFISIAVGLGMFIMWAAPHVWGYLKPLIHAFTS